MEGQVTNGHVHCPKEEAVQLLELLVSVCPKFGVESGSGLSCPAQ